jgi:hypothetical protein
MVSYIDMGFRARNQLQIRKRSIHVEVNVARNVRFSDQAGDLHSPICISDRKANNGWEGFWHAEKNISDLQKLMQIKSKIPAELEERASSRPAQSTAAATSVPASPTAKADTVRRHSKSDEQPAVDESAASAAASMRTYALWLSLCGMLLTGLSIFVLYSTRAGSSGVRSTQSTSDRRVYRHDRRTYRDCLGDK